MYSQLRPHNWATLLKTKNGWDFDSLFILDGVFNGFKVLDPSSSIKIYDCKNYKSCFREGNYEKMCAILTDELHSGKLSVTSEKPYQIHSLGAIPKPSGSVRHITDCSRPTFDSVNKYMKSTCSTFSFNTLDDIIKDVKPGSYMATVDLQNAYRSVPIAPADRMHFGLRWDFGSGPVYMTDNFLCFGSRCSAFIFNRLTDAVARYMGRLGYSCYNYLDDFIVIADSFERACQAQNALIKTLRSLGFYISWAKLSSPSQCCRFLGIDINSVTQQLILPSDKVEKLHAELTFWLSRRTATKYQMQRLCGILNFCCKVVRGGRVFMFHMIQMLKLFNNKRRIELPDSFFDDIQWWSAFAEEFNGYADFFDVLNNYVEIYTDACLYGLAAVCGNDFYQAKVYTTEENLIKYHATSPYAYDIYVPIAHAANINVLELIAVLLALKRWCEYLKNCRVILYCDNLQVCYNLAKDKTRNALSNACLKDIFWLCVSRNIYISPAYIPSENNTTADYLSRVMFA